jgi:glycosyltransferase involved in cell wall biosynthesis
LDWTGRVCARRVSKSGGRVIVNGGNCRWSDINWVHYVHAAYRPERAGRSITQDLRTRAWRAHALQGEGHNLRNARLIIANSEVTKRDILKCYDVDPKRIHTVHVTIDPQEFQPCSEEVRRERRAELGWEDSRPVMLFVGAMGDERKGFDTLFAAWKKLALRRDWDAQLVVVGAGGEIPFWQDRVEEAGLAEMVSFLGFRPDVQGIVSACDGLISPSKYEPFGLNVLEALCSGVPAIVGRLAGVAEVYPQSLERLLLADPGKPDLIVEALLVWRSNLDELRRLAVDAAAKLRSYSLENMATNIVRIIEGSV